MYTPVKSIFFVDDDPDDQLFFRDALEEIDSSINIKLFNNGKDLLFDLSKSNIPSTIFLDINMPIMNGIECLRALREHKDFKNVTVIMLSTSGNKESLDETIKYGADYYIQKPNNFQDLKGLLEKALKIIGMERKNISDLFMIN